VRLTPEGALDGTFRGSGAFRAFIGLSPAAVAVAPDRKIVVAGSGGTGIGWVVARFKPDGTTDDTFNGLSGRVSGTIGSGSSVQALAVAPGGEFFIGGTASGVLPESGNARDVFLARYLADGRPDNGFGTSGRAVANLGGDDAMADMAVLTDQSIVVAATTWSQSGADPRLSGDFAVAHFTPNGALDASFGTAGKAVTDFAGKGDVASAVAIQSDGRIVVGGQAYAAGQSTDFALARYEGLGAQGVEVAEAAVNGSSWTPLFRSYLEAFGYAGRTGFRLVNATQPYLLTQVGTNQVTVRLRSSAGAEQLGAEDLRVRGVNVADYGVSGFAYDPASRVATWTLSRPVDNDKILVELNADGDADYDLRWRLNVLGGDATADAQTTALDLSDVRRRLNRVATLPPTTVNLTSYSPLADVTGDGRINALDLSAVKQRLNRRLPTGQPATTAAPLPDGSVTQEFFGAAEIL
jgi:uncharacterized delta-60 repeat protein